MYNTRPEARTANSTCKKVAVQYSADIFVINQIFVLPIYSCGGRQFCAPKSPTS